QDNGAPKQVDALPIRCSIPIEGDTSQVELVSLLVGGRRRNLLHEVGYAERAGQFAPRHGSDLSLQLQQIVCGHVDRVMPQNTILLRVYSLHCDLKLFASEHIAACNNSVYIQFAADLAEVHAGIGIAASSD